MNNVIRERMEFVYFIECVNGNPNGDTDMGNAPRTDFEDGRWLITDVCIKRNIRNYVDTAYAGQTVMEIIVQNGTNINRFIAEAHEQTQPFTFT